ncbi:MAG: hypothetical protein LBQ68_05745 [Clostridiales bacterium]|nr:hypothetical protein [Clostridiales bacterium]
MRKLILPITIILMCLTVSAAEGGSSLSNNYPTLTIVPPNTNESNLEWELQFKPGDNPSQWDKITVGQIMTDAIKREPISWTLTDERGEYWPPPKYASSFKTSWLAPDTFGCAFSSSETFSFDLLKDKSFTLKLKAALLKPNIDSANEGVLGGAFINCYLNHKLINFNTCYTGAQSQSASISLGKTGLYNDKYEFGRSLVAQTNQMYNRAEVPLLEYTNNEISPEREIDDYRDLYVEGQEFGAADILNAAAQNTTYPLGLTQNPYYFTEEPSAAPIMSEAAATFSAFTPAAASPPVSYSAFTPVITEAFTAAPSVEPTFTFAPTATAPPTSSVAPTSFVTPTSTTAPPTSFIAPTSTTPPPTSFSAPITTVPPTSFIAPTSTTVPPTSSVAPTSTTAPPTSSVAPTSTTAPPTSFIAPRRTPRTLTPTPNPLSHGLNSYFDYSEPAGRYRSYFEEEETEDPEEYVNSDVYEYRQNYTTENPYPLNDYDDYDPSFEYRTGLISLGAEYDSEYDTLEPDSDYLSPLANSTQKSGFISPAENETSNSDNYNPIAGYTQEIWGNPTQTPLSELRAYFETSDSDVPLTVPPEVFTMPPTAKPYVEETPVINRSAGWKAAHAEKTQNESKPETQAPAYEPAEPPTEAPETELVNLESTNLESASPSANAENFTSPNPSPTPLTYSRNLPSKATEKTPIIGLWNVWAGVSMFLVGTIIACIIYAFNKLRRL